MMITGSLIAERSGYFETNDTGAYHYDELFITTFTSNSKISSSKIYCLLLNKLSEVKPLSGIKWLLMFFSRYWK